MNDKKIPAGTYRAKGIAGSEQYGVTSNGNDQVVLDLELFDIGEMVSTFLVFTDAAAQYSIDRLRALGWSGADLSNLSGIDQNEVEVRVKYDVYKGEEKMKVEILTGGSRVKLQDQMDDRAKKAFAAKFSSYTRGSAPAPSRQVPKGDVSL
jgi:hypothetical protein